MATKQTPGCVVDGRRSGMGARWVLFAMWLTVNLGFGTYGLFRYLGREITVEALSWTFVLSRVTAALMLPNIFIMLMLVDRWPVLTLLQSTQLPCLRCPGASFPIEQHKRFHRHIAWFLAVLALLHTGGHYRNMYRVSQAPVAAKACLFSWETECQVLLGTADNATAAAIAAESPYWAAAESLPSGDGAYWRALLLTLPGLTGHLMLLSMLVGYAMALPYMRRRHFSIFYAAHVAMFSVFAGCLVVHGMGQLLDQWRAIYFAGIPGLLIFAQWLRRWCSGTLRPMRLVSAFVDDSGVCRIELERPKHFKFLPGQYVFLRIPGVSRWQYHPYSISSHPDQTDTVSVHLRPLGPWSRAVRDLVGVGTGQALEKARKNIAQAKQLIRERSVRVERRPNGLVSVRSLATMAEHVVKAGGAITVPAAAAAAAAATAGRAFARQGSILSGIAGVTAVSATGSSHAGSDASCAASDADTVDAAAVAIPCPAAPDINAQATAQAVPKAVPDRIGKAEVFAPAVAAGRPPAAPGRPVAARDQLTSPVAKQKPTQSISFTLHGPDGTAVKKVHASTDVAARLREEQAEVRRQAEELLKRVAPLVASPDDKWVSVDGPFSTGTQQCLHPRFQRGGIVLVAAGVGCTPLISALSQYASLAREAVAAYARDAALFSHLGARHRVHWACAGANPAHQLTTTDREGVSADAADRRALRQRLADPGGYLDRRGVPRSITLIWAVPSLDAAAWGLATLRDAVTNPLLGDRVRVKLFVTRQPDHPTHVTFSAEASLAEAATALPDGLLELGNGPQLQPRPRRFSQKRGVLSVTSGRPDMAALIEEAVAEARQRVQAEVEAADPAGVAVRWSGDLDSVRGDRDLAVRRSLGLTPACAVGVFVCGPRAMASQTRKACNKHTDLPTVGAWLLQWLWALLGAFGLGGCLVACCACCRRRSSGPGLQSDGATAPVDSPGAVSPARSAHKEAVSPAVVVEFFKESFW